MSNIFSDIAQYRVTEAQPATSTSSGLDFERCSALHNAIVRYGWRASGYELADLPDRTWWASQEDEGEDLIEVESRLDHSVQEFLKRALNPDEFPDGEENSFFYTLAGLATPDQLWEFTDDINPEHITLYLTHEGLSDNLAGIVYDLTTHLCAFNGGITFGVYDGTTSPAWQPLETILSVYIDVIERRKAVALHKSIVESDRDFFPHPDDRSLVPAELYPNPLPREHTETGAKRGLHCYNPWTLLPYAERDLQETLDAWSSLLDAIEERRPRTSEATSEVSTRGIFTEAELQDTSLRVNGFAWRFFLRARKPTVAHIGPGLCLPTLEELSRSHFPRDDGDDPAFDSDSTIISPVPILLGSQTITSWLTYPFTEAASIPWGLYLDACGIDGPCPFEDGCRLALPFPLGANGFAKKADESPLNSGAGPASDGHAELYQLDKNPFMPDHSSQLLAVLMQFVGHVRSDIWNVGAEGVEGGADVFREADTNMARGQDDVEMVAQDYRLVLGAGDRYW